MYCCLPPYADPHAYGDTSLSEEVQNIDMNAHERRVAKGLRCRCGDRGLPELSGREGKVLTNKYVRTTTVCALDR